MYANFQKIADKFADSKKPMCLSKNSVCPHVRNLF